MVCPSGILNLEFSSQLKGSLNIMNEPTKLMARLDCHTLMVLADRLNVQF